MALLKLINTALFKHVLCAILKMEMLKTACAILKNCNFLMVVTIGRHIEDSSHHNLSRDRLIIAQKELFCLD